MKYKKNYKQNDFFSIYGINGCSSILNSSTCLINKIIVLKNFNFDKVSDKDIVNKYKDKIIIQSQEEHNNKYSRLRTQGIVINFNYPIHKDLPLDLNKRKKSCFVILDSIKDPQNLGQIIRTSECAGIDGIILSERRSSRITDVVLQVSQGAFCNINIIVFKNIKYAINELKNNGYWIIGFENSIKSKKWYQMDMTEKTAIVLGSEGEGIKPIIMKYCDYLATIPMQGKVNSLNVSATVSAILFERNRQILDKE